MLDSRLLLILIPALPLLAAIVTAILGPRLLRGQSHWPVILGTGASFVCALLLLADVRGQIDAGSTAATAETAATVGFQEVHTFWTWAHVPDAVPSAEGPGDFRIDVSLRADPLTCIMLVMVTLIGSLVAIYASGYMHGDRGYWRFFSYVALFVFSMTMLVSVSNFLLLFVFWEAVGACSYLLIGFWYEKPSAAAAGKKAFLVNRVGDFGFALALFMIWGYYGTLNFHDVDGVAGVLGQTRLAAGDFVGGGIGLAICLLLMLGACGKSAQFPLHVWLPDAMEGPTPVSALIHAATMVTAGVYMVTRCTPLFLVSPTAQVTVACVGAGTALIAGLIAMTQFDLKRVLAYSTVSQLGFMFLGLGTGTLAGIVAAMFHLFTHAFFKALLFLGSGSVMHAMGNVIDMRRFGGLKKLMPITHGTFAIGCLALAGLVPFSGFWSKDAIVASVQDQATAMQMALDARNSETAIVDDFPGGTIVLVSDNQHSPAAGEHAGDRGHAGHDELTTAHLANFSDGELRCGVRTYRILYLVALFTAFLTALYTFRAFYLTFYGDLVIPHEAGHHAHESPASMWVPLVILASFAAVVGLALEYFHAFAGLLMQTPSLATAAAQATPQPATFPPHGSHLGVAITSTAIAVLGIAVASYLYLGNTREASAIARILDSGWLGRPYQWSYQKFFFDELYDWAIVKPLRLFAALMAILDRWIIDGLVNFCGWIPRALGRMMRGLHSGLVPYYGLAMVVGMVLLFAARALWGSN